MLLTPVLTNIYIYIYSKISGGTEAVAEYGQFTKFHMLLDIFQESLFLIVPCGESVSI